MGENAPVPRAWLLAALVLTASCRPSPSGPTASAPTLPPPSIVTTSTATTSSLPPTSATAAVAGRPAWLGQRPLPLRSDGFGQVLPTPPELIDRRIATVDLLPAPAGGFFEWTQGPVPEDVLARSTWNAGCPVGVEDLRYLTISFYGFDGRAHTGELIVHAATADGLVTVFEALFENRFPIEEMRVVEARELDLPPTGDGNNTTSFVCRPAVGSGSWSQHAFGLAVDLNPFQNPYAKGDLVLPELASAYLDRDQLRPGMILPGDVAVEAFSAMSWGWGGDWISLKDFMHFSANGR